MISSEVQILAEQLIAQPSVTPDDKYCQQIIADYLKPLDFSIELLPSSEVSNLWAHYSTDDTPSHSTLVFAGHTDVVPAGPINQWHSDPFTPTIKNNLLYGRGAADMKGGLAAMLTAVKNFITNHKDKIKGSISFLITSDEEGPAIHGTKHVVDILTKRNHKVDYCIIGEPSSSKYLGDTIRNGRRGSLSGHLTVLGKQGHAAYPAKADNAIHICLEFLHELANTEWDCGNQDFPPTSFQLININSGVGVSNIIPGVIDIEFNFRYATSSPSDSLSQKVEDLINKYNLDYKIEWKYYAEPFLTPRGKFTDLVQKAVTSVTQKPCQLATDGGTSDGRFIFPALNCSLVELGPINDTIHQVNECICINDLNNLSLIYEEILQSIFLEKS